MLYLKGLFRVIDLVELFLPWWVGGHVPNNLHQQVTVCTCSLSERTRRNKHANYSHWPRLQGDERWLRRIWIFLESAQIASCLAFSKRTMTRDDLSFILILRGKDSPVGSSSKPKQCLSLRAWHKDKLSPAHTAACVPADKVIAGSLHW